MPLPENFGPTFIPLVKYKKKMIKIPFSKEVLAGTLIIKLFFKGRRPHAEKKPTPNT